MAYDSLAHHPSPPIRKLRALCYVWYMHRIGGGEHPPDFTAWDWLSVRHVGAGCLTLTSQTIRFPRGLGHAM